MAGRGRALRIGESEQALLGDRLPPSTTAMAMAVMGETCDSTCSLCNLGVQVTSLLKPVSITMMLVVFIVGELGTAPPGMQSGLSSVLVYHERPTDDSETITSGVLLNGAVIVSVLFLITSTLVFLYTSRCYLAIYIWLFLSVSTLLLFFGGYVAHEIVRLHEVPTDAITSYLLLYNFSAAGTLVVFWTECGCGPSPPLAFQQSYLVSVSALLAWSVIRLSEWTTWGLLVSVALWDLIAVLTPRGPLKILVELAEDRGEPIPGLVYEGGDLKLGLGDFVFYSVLVGRASMRGFAALLACALTVLAGLCATLALLPVLQRVLPALPISIAAGTTIFFMSDWWLAPMTCAVAGSSIFA